MTGRAPAGHQRNLLDGLAPYLVSSLRTQVRSRALEKRKMSRQAEIEHCMPLELSELLITVSLRGGALIRRSSTVTLANVGELHLGPPKPIIVGRPVFATAWWSLHHVSGAPSAAGVDLTSDRTIFL